MPNFVRAGQHLFNIDRVYAVQAIPFEHASQVAREIQLFLACDDPAKGQPSFSITDGPMPAASPFWEQLSKGRIPANGLAVFGNWAFRPNDISHVELAQDQGGGGMVTVKVDEWPAYDIRVDQVTVESLMWKLAPIYNVLQSGPQQPPPDLGSAFKRTF